MRCRRGALAAAALSCALVAAATADVIYVRAGATGANDGSSWADAFVSLPSALTAAGAGDEIWVAAATYRPTATTDRTASFALEDGVAIYGGFTGAETSRSQRDPAANVTILSGDIGAAGDALDNSYHVVRAGPTVTASAVLDGFTISGGRADGAAPDNLGGGLYNDAASPTLARLTFLSNYAADRGGGMRIVSGNPAISDSRFESNSSGIAGGGLSSGTASSVTIRNGVFRGNTTGAGRGGGIDANSVQAANCVIAGNSPNGANLFQQGSGFINCTFTGNAGYGLFFADINNAVTNSILWGDATGEIFLGFSGGVAVNYSDIQADGFFGAGNIDANPLFLDAASGDLRLGPGSPAVDAGQNAAVPGGVTTDVLGLPRFFDDPAVADTGAGSAPIVDMGAHERIPISVTAPASQSVCAGSSVGLSVSATGQPALSYRWRKNGSNLSDGSSISGSTTSDLSIDPAATGDSGSYDVVVTDGFGQILTSAAATLAVNPVPATPVITVPKSVVIGATGIAASVASHGASTYAWTVAGGVLAGGQGTSQIAFDAGPAGTTMTLAVVETAAGCVSPSASAKVQVDFADVSPANPFRDFINTIARNGITAGCGGGKYCPAAAVTRAQMAVFLLKGKHGSGYTPPPAAGVFDDVAPGGAFAPWIEQLFAEGITAGCNPDNYCPGSPNTRGQMAVFLTKTFELSRAIGR